MTRWLLFFALLSFPILDAAQFEICKGLLATHKTHFDSGTIVESIEYEGANGSIFVMSLWKDGGVSLYVKNTDEKGHRINSDLVPKEAFQRVIQLWGDKVKSFQTNWVTSEDGPSRNYDEFIAAMKKGIPPKEAVFETWSGKQAKAAGFSKCTEVHVEYDYSRRPKRIFMVNAVFVRP